LARRRTTGKRISVFSTSLGWVAAAWEGELLRCLTFGYADPQSVVEAIRRLDPLDSWEVKRSTVADPFAARLRDYGDGNPDDFQDVPLSLGDVTDFQRRVLQQCRRIGYGQTLTYAQLAARAGFPRAARAVGNVMAGNRLPLVIPCHRVVAAGGSLGGYSSPHGVGMKRRLLELEGAL
jgi:methylated-DNA-[protein]-cysteine S-methyltransferase